MPEWTTPAEASPQLLKIQHRWPLIARDIILMSVSQAGTSYTPEDIAKSYDLTPDEFVTLMRLPMFVEIFKGELSRLKELGPFAGYRMRTEALISDLQERLYLRAQSGVMDDKQMLQFLTVLMKSAGLDAPNEPQQTPSTVNQTAVNISFNIPKLPSNKKLAHIINQPQTKVIDYTE